MGKTKLLVVIVVSLAVMLGGCAKEAKQTTGFLSTYKNLEVTSDNTMRYTGSYVGRYSKFILDPITVKCYDEATAKKVNPEDANYLEVYLYTQILVNKPEQYHIVSTPGYRVAIMRIGVTNLEKLSPWLNIMPWKKLSGVGLGQASAEMELVDSQTGEQLTAAIISEPGSTFSLSGLSNEGEVEAVMKDWAKRIWERVDEAHGIQPK